MAQRSKHIEPGPHSSAGRDLSGFSPVVRTQPLWRTSAHVLLNSIVLIALIHYSCVNVKLILVYFYFIHEFTYYCL